MNPLDPPRLFGDSPGRAVFKSCPGDFQVEEILGFEPSGEGEHCFLWVEKTGRNTNDVAGHFADQLGIRKRLISHCGLKDKEAVTRQWFSLHLPGQESPPADLLEAEGLRVLKVSRNLRKLRRGSHDGNRFTIRLRDCECSRPEVERRWERMIAEGLPNYFGPQRFGRGGNNVRQGRELLNGQIEVRDRLIRGLLLSAVRSFLFNLVVGTRVQGGTFATPLEGEVFGFPGNRSLVLPHNLHGNEVARVASGALELTAPLWGEGELQSVSEVRQLEQEIVAQEADLALGLERLGLRQERRVIRLTPQEATLTWENEAELCLRFDLPKGTYATTVLRELIDFNASGFDPT
ncbi:MAG: tRNA pseudouridine(13) synthase TruD [Verrucomicrobiales bacterium]|nr:tRNA pseudouridine(13) synthase TruD [Verrucomicrobiales bacterium]